EPPITARRDSAPEAMSRKVGLSEWLHWPKAHWLAHLSWQVTAERLPRTASFMSRGRSIRAMDDVLRWCTRLPAHRDAQDQMTVRHEGESLPACGERADEHRATGRCGPRRNRTDAARLPRTPDGGAARGLLRTSSARRSPRA